MENVSKTRFPMFANYFITAFRNIIRHKVFSLIVVLGLTIGVALFGLIFQFVNHELSYDRFNEHYKSVYRLEYADWALLGTIYAQELAGQFPEIVSSTRISTWEGNGVTLKVGDNLMKLENMIYADSGFFRIFTFHFIKGDPQHALDAPNSIVLTESAARQIFGNEDPINKSFLVNSKAVFTVTGIIPDVDRFHIKMNAVASFISLKSFYDEPDFLNRYGVWNYYTYFNLKENSDPQALAGKINAFYTGRANWLDSKPEFLLRPLREIYFTHVKNDIPSEKANYSMLWLYLLIAVFILAIACVNFINLTIARSSARSREIGVRMVMGSNRSNLITQFLGESILYALIATEFSLVLMDLLRPGFNSLVQRQLSFLSISWLGIVFIVLVLPAIIGVLAGIYPALYLTRFKPVITLKSEKTRGKGSLFFRRALIIGQFAISIMLIVATLTVHKQLQFMQKADLGFSRDNIINIYMNSSLAKHRETFRQMLMNDPGVRGTSMSTQAMDHVTWQESIKAGTEGKQFTFMGIDADFVPLMEMKIIEGRNFQPETPSDSGKVIINEESVRFFSLKEPVIGQVIGTGERRLEILGVVKDFHFNSLRNPIGPMVMMLRDQYLSAMNIKVDSRDLPATLGHLQKAWNTFCPDFLFEYSFLDKNYEQLYKDEVRLGRLFFYLALLAIFIASIGLMGLSSFLAEQRMKEIGIRKATGDTTAGIIRLFSGEFAKWVFLSGLIAMPIAYFIMNKWLNGFAYHVSVDGWILCGSCLAALIIALTTVVAQTYKIAARNPVEALRYE
jgi:putative ABC transport system permease protein